MGYKVYAVYLSRATGSLAALASPEQQQQQQLNRRYYTAEHESDDANKNANADEGAIQSHWQRQQQQQPRRRRITYERPLPSARWRSSALHAKKHARKAQAALLFSLLCVVFAACMLVLHTLRTDSLYKAQQARLHDISKTVCSVNADK